MGDKDKVLLFIEAANSHDVIVSKTSVQFCAHQALSSLCPEFTLETIAHTGRRRQTNTHLIITTLLITFFFAVFPPFSSVLMKKRGKKQTQRKGFFCQ